MPRLSRGLVSFLRCGATLEDFADRLNYFWTFWLLVLFACIISWKQGYSKPVVCAVPPLFTGQNIKYAEATCWNTYNIRFEQERESTDDVINRDEIPVVKASQLDSSSLDKSYTVTYYQILPLILCFQALFFKLPSILMYLLHGFSGVSFDKLAGLTHGWANLCLQDRQLLSKMTARYLYNWCKQFENFLPWRWLSVVWLLVKVLYCVNIVVQLIILDRFLRTTDPPVDNSTSYGEVITDNLLKNNATLWRQAPPFPREIICIYEIRAMVNVHKFDLHCRLPVNDFNESVYMFLWVWFVFVAMVTTTSIVIWFLRTIVPFLRRRFITNMLFLEEELNVFTLQNDQVDLFVRTVGEDGVLALKLIGANSSDHVVRDVVWNMWKMKEADMTVISPPDNVATSSGRPGPQVKVLPGRPPYKNV